MEKKHSGEPLGKPDRERGSAKPPGAGEEGGSGSWGDQRQARQEEGPKEEPLLDGTIRKEHIEGDQDEKRPGARFAVETLWEGRLSMEIRKREPLIIW